MSGNSSSVEFEPPLACVRRLLKQALPSSTNVGKDASSAFARACGIFVLYVTTCSNDYARENRRQTITANDVMAAAKELGFEEFLPQLTAFLKQHRAEEQTKKDAKKAADAKKSRDRPGTTMDEPASKRHKMSSSKATKSKVVAVVEEPSDDESDDEEEEEEEVADTTTTTDNTTGGAAAEPDDDSDNDDDESDDEEEEEQEEVEP